MSRDDERQRAYGDCRELILAYRPERGADLFDVSIGGLLQGTARSISAGLRLGRLIYNAPFYSCGLDDLAFIIPKDGAYVIICATRRLPHTFPTVPSAF